MAGYPYVGQVTDQNAQKSLKAAFDLIFALRNQIDALQASVLSNAATINANGQRVANLGNPQSEQDAVTVAYLRAFVNAQLESFKGNLGVDAVIDTSATFIVTVENGIIVSVE